jgi:hypothetical protein
VRLLIALALLSGPVIADAAGQPTLPARITSPIAMAAVCPLLGCDNTGALGSARAL